MMSRKNRFTPVIVPGCTVAFSTGSASGKNETLVLKNGDIDSHWHMQMMLSSGSSGRPDRFYTGPLAHLAGRKAREYIGQRCLSYWAPHMGINESGVSICLLATPGREDNQKKGLLGGFDYNRVVLEHADSAEEAIRLLGSTVEKCGFSDFSMSYVIGDPEEVWLIEASGFEWAAKRYRNDTGVHANSYILEEEWDLSSPKLVEYARGKGWLGKGENLSFKKIYSGSGYLHERDAPLPDIYSSTVRFERARDLVQSYRQNGPVTIKKLMQFSRDQLDDFTLKNGEKLIFNQTPWHSTEFYRDRFSGGEWLDVYPEGDNLQAPVFIRQICCDTVYEKTLGSAVFVSGKNHRGYMFALTGVPTFSIFSPFFPNMDYIHPAFSGIEAAKLFESLDLQAFGKYQEFHPIAESIFNPLEKKVLDATEKVLQTPEARNSAELSSFSFKCAEQVVAAGSEAAEQFQLFDLRLREWGRERKKADKIPTVYTIIGEKTAVGIGSEINRPLVIEKEGELLIDYSVAEACFSAGTGKGDSEEYVSLATAAEELGFDWEEAPATGDLFLYKK